MQERFPLVPILAPPIAVFRPASVSARGDASGGRRAARRRLEEQWFHLAAVLGLSFTLAATAQGGDILRGGAGAGPRGSAGAPANPNAALTEQLRANAQDSLKRTTLAVDSVKALQNAARSMATKGPTSLGGQLPKVPNGLAPGGLQVAPGVPANLAKPGIGEDAGLWVGAKLPVQSQFAGRTRVTVEQLKSQALLTWETFNVGKETTLEFNQSRGGVDKGKWIAFNRVLDPSGNPSQILGQINAPGQVYIINRNGIIFGGSSQVNLTTLTASSLPINDNLISRGLLNNPDAQFLFSALPVAAGAKTPAFNPTITDPEFDFAGGGNTYTLAEQVALNVGNAPVRAPEFTFKATDGSLQKLIAGTDYTLSVVAATRQATATFTPAGLAKIGAATVKATYTPVVVKSGDVIVQAGASINSVVNVEGNGGRVLLVGANVRNEGTISTPAGQTILAAGLQLGLDAHKSDDASLRGLDSYVGAVGAAGVTLPPVGTVTHGGLIEAPRGNVTMIGKTVEQLSVIDSSTTTALNGRVDLLASYGATPNPNYDATKPANGPIFLNRATGTVEIGPGSMTSILPDYAGTDRAVGTELALPSQINIQGKAIHFAGTSQILAPNANVTISAGNWVTAGQLTALKFTGGQIYFDPGASIDVAGSIDITAPLTQNFLTLQLRGAELSNSPLQRDGLLRGPSITVDARQSGIYNGQYWIGTPLGDVSGYLNIIERTVGELTSAGGTVTLNAGESVVMQQGSKIDVSGGWINFEGGMVQTTRVMSQGVLYDLSQATPDRVYDGIYTGTTTFSNPRYGISETFSHPLALTGTHFEQGYTHGANAGTITISAPAQALDGSLLGRAVQGPRQQNETTIALAKAGTLNLNFRSEVFRDPAYYFASPTPPKIVFTPFATPLAADAFSVSADGVARELRIERKKEVFLSPELLANHGFGTLAIDNSDGTISVPEGTALTAPLRGSISFRAANLDIGGSVTAPGGNLSFSVFNFSPYSLTILKAITTGKTTPAVDPDRGVFSLGSGASLSTAGLITDYRAGAFRSSDELVLPPLVDGGTITINAFTANLAAGGVIDVSGGVSISATGRRTYGAGGSLAINAGNEPEFPQLLGGGLLLESTLKGFSGGKGGSLTVQAPMVQVGGPLPSLVRSEESGELVYLIEGTEVARNELLYLSPDFFRQGGFSSYTINGLGKAINAAGNSFLPAVTIAPNTIIRPIAESWLAVQGIAGGPVTLQTLLKPEGLRAPVSLSFGSSTIVDTFANPANNILRGDIIMGAGSLIVTDPLANVTLRGSTVAVLGSIIAPGGNITVTGANAFPSFNTADPDFLRALPTVHLGPNSFLSTAGRTVLTPDAYGRRVGAVLPGGTITVSGNIVAEGGSVLDVSGATGILDLAPTSLASSIPIGDAESSYRAIPLNSGINAPLFSLVTVPTQVDSDGGSISLRGAQELFTDATLRGFAGGPTARGGTLVISSSRFIDPNGAPATPLDVNLIVTQDGRNVPKSFYPKGETAIGNAVPVVGGDPRLGLGHFSANTFLQGGFDSLMLSGNAPGGTPTGAVGFSGPVSISARRSLSIADGGVIFADGHVYLQAPYVALGTSFQSPVLSTEVAELSLRPNFFALPSTGSGSLTVRASLIDIGNLSLQNIGRATFIADGGDIRGNGTLDIAGDLTLRAGQVYPTTAGRFTIAAYDPNIAVAASSTASTQVTLASTVLPPGFGVGSPLLGSKVAAINGTTVTLEGNANATITGTTLLTYAPGKGSVTIEGSGSRPLPLSAGGTLSIYGSSIRQSGTLRAPLGTINLGWDGTGASPIDYLSGAGLQPGRTVAVTQQLTLSRGSLTSVTAIDPFTGEGVLIPYGLNANDRFWIDPTGADITAGGLVDKGVNLFGVSITDQAGSVIDIRGGGDLYSYRWVNGLGGTIDVLGSASATWNGSTSYNAGDLVRFQGATWSARRASIGVSPTISLDWSLVPQSFAVLPDYQANYAPYAPFNNRPNPLNLASSDPGYVSTGLSVGDRIYLGASSGLSAGNYTLLPARYALLPGAVLVTPQAGVPIGTFLQPEGASTVAGYRFNELNGQQLLPVQATRFEVAPSEVVRARAEYDDYFANIFLKQSALDLGLDVPRLPFDSGRAVLSGLNALQIDGDILGRTIGGGHDARIDISSLADIFITRSGKGGAAGKVVLGSWKLNSFGAESLLIGGLRQTSPNGTTITVKTGNVTVNNAGAPLVGPEIIIVANQSLTLARGAEIIQSGSTYGSSQGDRGTLRLGDAAVAGSGNGLLLRVSDQQVRLVRSGVTSLAAQAALANPPVMTIGAGASISGAALILDSTYGTSLDPTARIDGDDIALNSGQISIQFDNPGAVPQIAGLMLTGPALKGLQSAGALSLLSYSSIDLYGTGGFTAGGILALNAGEIRGFNNGGGTVTLGGSLITLGNRTGSVGPGPVSAPQGGLVLDSGTIRLGTGSVRIDQFATVDLNTTGSLVMTATGGLTTQGALTIRTPVITATKAVNYSVTAEGTLDLLSSAGGSTRTAAGGLGATLSFTGTSISANTNIVLPSGSLTLRATTGDLLIGNLNAARFDVGGTSRTFNDLTRYTDGGRINIVADAGSVSLGTDSVLDVAADRGGGNAGSVSISAANGTFTLNGTLAGAGGEGGQGGSFSLDVQSLPDVTPTDQTLNDASFDGSRIIRVRNGDIVLDGLAVSQIYRLSADQGSITITGNGRIDASGAEGGDITLAAFGDVTLQSGAQLTVAADDFDSAGKGGTVSLEAGSPTNGVTGPGFVDIQGGSTIDLSVASVIGATPAETAANTAAAALLGQFTGTLHLRAPQIGTTDLQVNAIDGTILNASSILVEGYRLFDLTGSGAINAGVQANVKSNGIAFGANITAITTRLLANNAGLAPVLVVAPGAEIINRTGNLTLGLATTNASSDWDLSGYRVGPKGAAGVLTLRAAGNLVFFNALSDGFTSSANTAELLAYNPLLPTNTQSWTYRLTAGADLSAADFHRVQSLSTLGANTGSLQLGKTVTTNNGIPAATGNVNSATNTTTAVLNAQNGRYQVIRTGSGDIDISAGRDVQLMNQLATIYTAGTRVADPTLGGNFEVPPSVLIGPQSTLGTVQQNPTYAAQYSLAGGNVTINAQRDINHQTVTAGVVVEDSQKQIPNNWLYRRGFVDPATGEFGVTRDGDIASTTWWVDFSNFFQGVGALGGGNVSLIAGNDVRNVDAVAPTNGRVTFQTPTGDRQAANQPLLELGGGDVTVRAGRNLDAGIYYVERGRGTLAAGNSIITNRTRAANPNGAPASSITDRQWLPTTLFLGKGGFDVSAGGDVLLGPTVNPFLLPVGLNNSFWRKSYFSTYGSTSEVNVTSLGGNITLRQNYTPPGSASPGDQLSDSPILMNWIKATHNQTQPGALAISQPWLRLAETQVDSFATVTTVLPGTVRAIALSGDINLVGRFNLSPSPVGTIELAAGGAINGLQPSGTVIFPGNLPQTTWTSAKINLSDANPASIFGINTPFGYQGVVSSEAGNNIRTNTDLLLAVDNLFNESGSSTGVQAVIQTQQTLHGTSLLHAEDPEPIRLYAGNGNISGLTLFSGKFARVVAGNDISDVSLYLQNNNASDFSVVSAGRDIIAYNANTPLRVSAQAPGNFLNFNEFPLAGDLQINGPGTLIVLAGRNFDLGSGANNADGTGVGLTSIGNARNPNLPFNGADIVAGAGIGPAFGLANSPLDFETFITDVLEGADGERYIEELKKTRTDVPDDLGSNFDELDPETQAKFALEIFYLVLRDAGRDHNIEGSAGFGNYDAGFEAIKTLFGEIKKAGDINTRSRDIRTKSGGSISLLAPGGKLTLTTSVIGNPLAPPGVLTEAGGNISIFADGNVDIGISRIFTLRGGNQIIWSSSGNIAAGSSSKTVQSAPPTRVLIDAQTATVQTDLAGLATGGGIGVLATVEGVQPGSVDLIAPAGVVDAGDAGIRASGDLNIAAVQVLNADNIQASGTSVGVPTTVAVSAPSLAGLGTASNSTAAANNAAAEVAKAQQRPAEPPAETPSAIAVEVVDYEYTPALEAVPSAPPSSVAPPLPTNPTPEEEEEERRKRRAVPAYRATVEPPSGQVP